MSALAEKYEKRWPGVDIPDAQKELRQQMDDFKHDRLTHRRTMRTSYVMVPAHSSAFDSEGRLNP